MKIDRIIKERILAEILKNDDFLGRYSNDIVSFIDQIWPLREMPSTDERYKTALEDFTKHLVNNNDWETSYVFLERLNIIEGDEAYFIKFLDFVVSPQVRLDKNAIIQYVSVINLQLTTGPYRLTIVDYFESLPVFKVKEKSAAADLPIDIQPNIIPFYKSVKPKMEPPSLPCFILIYDNWDDYGYKTLIDLDYYDSSGQVLRIGKVKILLKEFDTTWDGLAYTFTFLPEEFCSIGQSSQYYLTMKGTFGPSYQSVLVALRDVALFPRIHEEFENVRGFTRSLLRDNNVEMMVRTIRYELNGMDLKSCFTFYYHYTPPYSKDPLTLFFDFRYRSEFDHRVYALIGKNGTGKTRLLATLAKDLSQANAESIRPFRPLYAKVFTVSYSYFDRFEIPGGNVEFNYVYCGLKTPDGRWMTPDELRERFLSTAEKIIEKRQTKEWFETLGDFIPEDLLSVVFQLQRAYGRIEYIFRPEAVDRFHQMLSSGQNILVYIVSEILAQIRFNSLILYDEPETHLHPNAVSSLMFTIFNLVKRFDSFCILATHSPIVIQEIPSRNIFIIERENEHAEVRKLQMESFGENLTVITDEIFGNRMIAKYHYQVLDELANSGRNYDEILKLLQAESNLPIPLTTRLILQSLMPEQK